MPALPLAVRGDPRRGIAVEVEVRSEVPAKCKNSAGFDP
jgi:hypothetical protein